MTLISELIDVPEQVHKGDFVLRLAEGVDHADQTLDSYVVTPELVENFREALGFIKSAVEQNSSKATYLHGSFGSGKSHFMAVLHLLLHGNARARSLPELADVISKNAWLEGKKFLLVPYHMIGARSMEAAILGNYVDYVGRQHPGAPVPGVYRGEALFRDAERMRESIGDEAFLSRLNAGANRAEWGEMEASWDAASYAHALAAKPGSEERTRLVGDLVGTLFTSYSAAVQGQAESFIPIDEGLSVLSRHAKALGYDALILFLDELILWLASHAADSSFVRDEIQKIAKLVEAQDADRPTPIVSFVARQRDLRELIGDYVPGAEHLAFADTLRWWEGRLHTITLEDRNLPAIVQKRVLKPKSAAAKKQLDDSFEETAKVRREVMETLLTSQADRAMFRQVYPFTPALVATLVAVSSLLQRERTAIKVMLQLLVDQRDTLALGDVVPVGDLFDVIAEGDEAFSEGMRRHFDNAKRLYHQKLVPLLEEEHGVRRDDVLEGRAEEGKARAFRNDDRLLKTLLLAALVPEVEPLKNLTAERIAALNHGTVKTPIPGDEGRMVRTKVRKWAARVGEIKIGEEADPTISVQISGVDVESILEKARVHDTQGERRRKVRELVFQDIGLEDRDELFLRHEFLFRNTRRQCDVLFGNVRELPFASMTAQGERWKVVVDFPFDEEGFTPRDDIAKLQTFRERNEPSRTTVWLPSFFSRDAQRDLGNLVVIEHVLTGERFADYASHLIAADRAQAKSLLENQRSQLRVRVRQYLEAAFGVAQPQPGWIDVSHELGEHVQSLDPTFQPRLPVGNSLGQAMQNLLDQMLAHQFPDHPHFEGEVTLGAVRKVHTVFCEQEREGARIAVDKTLRPVMRQIAVPLRLGEMGETHFVPGDHWLSHFRRKRAQADGVVSVAALREWMDEPRPSGLPTWIQNLLILFYANAENYSFQLHGGPAGQLGVDAIADDLVLVAVDLPSEDEWAAANERAGAVFGVPALRLCNSSNVDKLADEVKRIATAHRDDCAALCGALRRRLDAAAPRLRTAESAATLVDAIAAAPAPIDVVRALATGRLETSPAAVGSSIKRAGEVRGRLEGANWEVFDALKAVQDARRQRAAGIAAAVEAALSADEYVTSLPAVLKAQQHAGFELLFPPPPKGEVFATGEVRAASPATLKTEWAKLESELAEHEGAVVDLSWTVKAKGK